MTTPTPTLTLSDAIAAFESVDANLKNANATVTNDQGVVSAAQLKLDSANQQLTTDTGTRDGIVSQEVDALKSIVAAAGAMIDNPTGPAPAAPPADQPAV